MKPISDKFKTLQAWFSRPGRWTQFAAARDAKGVPIDSGSDQVESLCLAEAMSLIYVEGTEKFKEAYDRLLTEINKGLPVNYRWESLMMFNDDKSRKYKHIRQAIVKANV
jgi:hypothetical protein